MARRHAQIALAVVSLVLAASVAGAGELYAQHAHEAEQASGGSSTVALVFGFLELPFLILCVYFAFRTAIALKGGIFGEGMMLLAWGFLIMAVGHAHMQVEHVTGFNLFASLLGPTGGSVAWVVALTLTWGLSGVGFYRIYKVSRGTVTA